MTQKKATQFEHQCPICHTFFMAGNNRVTCSAACSNEHKKNIDNRARKEVAEGTRVRVAKGKTKPVEKKPTCSVCGGAPDHIKFGRECRAIAAQSGIQMPGYVSVK
jgi:hypothetical protein